MSEGRRALVIGSGVIGLSTAVRLREAGVDVDLWTAERWPGTTSNISAAIWWPFHAHPAHLVEQWAAESLAVYERLSHDREDSGVRMVRGKVVTRGAQPSDPVDVLEPTVPVIDISAYLPWLEAHAISLGARFTDKRIETLDEALAYCDLVINCTGLGAATLVPDPSMVPIRGQVVRVECTGINVFHLEDTPTEVTYIIPRRKDVILGGTVEPGVWDRTPNPDTAEAIIRRCKKILPQLESATVLEHRVGLRPGRPSVRLEVERREAGVVVHNYGHGGSGVTIAWGCARQVVQLIKAYQASS
jgi:D-amino-acid oxidase